MRSILAVKSNFIFHFLIPLRRLDDTWKRDDNVGEE